MKLTKVHPFAFYLAVSILTFGYSASAPKPHCAYNVEMSCRVVSATVAGAVWPAYWTWVAFDAGRAALAQGGGE